MHLIKHFSMQLISFTYQQAMSCIFPACIFVTIVFTKLVPVPYVHPYDFILLVCIGIQFIMYKTGMETKDEVKVICLFHLIGLVLEIYKVHMGSWTYPQEGWTKVLGVPLYSGFMYSSVASYLCQAWRRFDLGMRQYPKAVWTIPLGFCIYANFMLEHFMYDFRWILTALLFVVFFRTYVTFVVRKIQYRMPLTLSFILIGFFIWVAENIGTYLGAWRYPNQKAAWQLVQAGKISSWFLLVIISIILVAQLKHVKESLIESKDYSAQL